MNQGLHADSSGRWQSAVYLSIDILQLIDELATLSLKLPKAKYWTLFGHLLKKRPKNSILPRIFPAANIFMQPKFLAVVNIDSFVLHLLQESPKWNHITLVFTFLLLSDTAGTGPGVHYLAHGVHFLG
jgi:hypothetical protein